MKLTGMFNRRRRTQLEATMTKLCEGDSFLVCAALFEQRLLDHLAQPQNGEDVSVRSPSLNGLWARDVLAGCTDARLGNHRFRWLSAQQIPIVSHDVWALRMSYAGELGWDFRMPNAAGLDVYDALWSAGQAFGRTDCDPFAMNVMRMEKRFKGVAESTNEVIPLEAYVMRFVAKDKAILGKAQSLAETTDLHWVCIYLEGEPDGVNDGHGGEAVLLNDRLVGSTASIFYGNILRKILAFAYFRPEAALGGRHLDVIIAGQRRAAKVLREPAYDPTTCNPEQIS